MPATNERWPPVYDENDLEGAIASALRQIGKTFFEPTLLDGWCQGDIVGLAGAVPIVGPNGEVSVLDVPSSYWLLLGNSCDLDRSLDEVAWAPAIPLLPCSLLSPQRIATMQSYQTVRTFFVQSWGAETGDAYGDFTLMASVSRQWLLQQKPVARLRQASWTLLNACLVRYLARSDGRND
ncbi:MAG TPA: hypothetical protein PLF40_03630 [Kofleriaceae bacterium]|nr:hypothetical protein [Kofleriaceae bacterium]